MKIGKQQRFTPNLIKIRYLKAIDQTTYSSRLLSSRLQQIKETDLDKINSKLFKMPPNIMLRSNRQHKFKRKGFQEILLRTLEIKIGWLRILSLSLTATLNTSSINSCNRGIIPRTSRTLKTLICRTSGKTWEWIFFKKDPPKDNNWLQSNRFSSRINL